MSGPQRDRHDFNFATLGGILEMHGACAVHRLTCQRMWFMDQLNVSLPRRSVLRGLAVATALGATQLATPGPVAARPDVAAT